MEEIKVPKYVLESIEEHVYFEDLGFRVHEVESVEEKITHWMPIELPDGYEDLH